jgi:hypothetical protein
MDDDDEPAEKGKKGVSQAMYIICTITLNLTIISTEFIFISKNIFLKVYSQDG